MRVGVDHGERSRERAGAPGELDRVRLSLERVQSAADRVVADLRERIRVVARADEREREEPPVERMAVLAVVEQRKPRRVACDRGPAEGGHLLAVRGRAPDRCERRLVPGIAVHERGGQPQGENRRADLRSAPLEPAAGDGDPDHRVIRQKPVGNRHLRAPDPVGARDARGVPTVLRAVEIDEHRLFRRHGVVDLPGAHRPRTLDGEVQDGACPVLVDQGGPIGESHQAPYSAGDRVELEADVLVLEALGAALVRRVGADVAEPDVHRWAAQPAPRMR